jgi:hypothetical protein
MKSLAASWLEVGITGHNFGRGPPKDHSTKVWLQLAQWFLRRRLKCETVPSKICPPTPPPPHHLCCFAKKKIIHFFFFLFF